ncbi:MAG TPA: YncE family protein [Verrucomicrobiae bacterium]|jgi:DNA-binding beta-propeller fold protein YncE|nr:YncE family protein [Verrucomicrobiae bacterium]
MKTRFFNLVALATVSAVSLCGVCRADDLYHYITKIPIGGKGGWDYLSIDPDAHRLYVSHATEIVVIDLKNNQIVGEITNTPGVHGIALAPKLGLGVTSDGREDKAGIVDLKTLQTLSKVDTSEGPDGMIYNPAAHEAYLFCGRANAATVVDVKEQEVVATVPLGGRPEFAQADLQANRVYNNLEDKSEVAVIDGAAHTVVTNWPIAPGDSASGMAIDVKNHRLFIGCHNQMMVMMDDQTGKVVATVPIGQGVDADAFDPKTKLAFASCGDGTTTIAHEDSPDKLTVVQTLQTQRGARTMALDPVTHNIYLATADFEASTNSPSGGERRRRPRMIPGTMRILVYGMEH